jgi:hypothetical protein
MIIKESTLAALADYWKMDWMMRSTLSTLTKHTMGRVRRRISTKQRSVTLEVRNLRHQCRGKAKNDSSSGKSRSSCRTIAPYSRCQRARNRPSVVSSEYSAFCAPSSADGAPADRRSESPPLTQGSRRSRSGRPVCPPARAGTDPRAGLPNRLDSRPGFANPCLSCERMRRHVRLLRSLRRR